MSKQKFALRIWKNKYIPFFCSLIVFFSILTPVKAHMLVNNQSLISQNNTRQPQTKPRIRRIRKKYKQSPNTVPIKDTTSSSIKGTRTFNSCESKSEEKITILAPSKGNNGKTVSTNPTFAWYIPVANPYLVRFSIFQDEEKEPFYSSKRVPSKQGIMVHTLPKNLSLSANRNYTWKVIIYCNSAETSKNFAVESKLQVVQVPSNLETQINSINNPLEIVGLYADNGLWYDAFAQTLQNSNNYLMAEEKLWLLVDLKNEDTDKDLQIQLQKIIDRMSSKSENINTI